MYSQASRSYGKLLTSMKDSSERLVTLVNEERPDRKYNRAVKTK